MTKRVVIRVRQDGSIEARSLGALGRSCMRMIEPVERMLGASVVQSERTADYYETQHLPATIVDVQAQHHKEEIK